MTKQRITAKQRAARKRNIKIAQAARRKGGYKPTYNEIVKMAKRRGIKQHHPDVINFPTKKHWVKISRNYEGIPWVEKKSRETAKITVRKAKSTTKMNPTNAYLRNLFKARD